jgi:hypothetical protein
VAAIRTEYGPAGEILHLVPYPLEALPPVTKRDLEQAWEAARADSLKPGRRATDARTRLIRFSASLQSPLDLALTDRDAASWASAIDGVADLSTSHGISTCLRLLALVELMGRSTWARDWFTLNRAGLDFHPALLQAAALSPLTETGGFAETALRALLPGAAGQQE